MYEYHVSRRWCGWWGGWGSTNAIVRHIARHTGHEEGGWRLVSTERKTAFYLWFIPRTSVMFVFEREVTSPQQQAALGCADPKAVKLERTQ